MCEPVVPPTEKAKTWRVVLTIMGFIHLALAIMYCFVAFMPGIYELVIVSILFCSIASVNFCCLTLYMIYIAMNIFTSVSMLGLAIQTQALSTVFASGNSPVIFQVVVVILILVYDIVALVICFYAYREFKGMLLDAGVNGGGMMGMPGMGGA